MLLCAIPMPAHIAVPMDVFNFDGDQSSRSQPTPTEAGLNSAPDFSASGKPAEEAEPLTPAAAAAASAQPASPSAAAGVSSAAEVEGDEVVVVGRSANLLGRADSASQGHVSADDLSTRPLLRPAEVLEAVPGLMITQHSGDGKANQYFTRGFNLDHGTDFAFSADGVPVNLPSQAHGQGYADLNFLIPELIQSVDYRKGPYSVENGDFATAGAANFSYPFRLKAGLADVTVGSFNYERAVAAAPLDLGHAGQLYYAVEGTHQDGPWDVPEAFSKLNLLLHYGLGDERNGLLVACSLDESAWDATNQTPDSAVQEGLINRYGSLDPSDGGQTQRMSVWSTWKRTTDNNEAMVEAYASQIGMKLWNDFTFYLNNTSTADQFEQADERTVTGLKVRDTYSAVWAGVPNETEAGADVRNDNITTLALYNTEKRVELDAVSNNDVVITDVAPYIQNTAHWTPWLRTELGFREDFLSYNVGGPSASQRAQSSASMPEPKVGVALGPWGPVELYGNFGQSFHSNDARILTPDSLSTITPGAPTGILARAQGLEGGLRLALGDYRGTVAVWQLKLASELTFDGDAGESQVGGASTRQGVEWSNNFHWKCLVLDADYAFSQARFDSEDPGDDGVQQHPGYYVPESIEQAASATLGLQKMGPFTADARIRYFGPRALVSDDSIRSSSSTLTSLRVAYEPVRGQTLSLDVFNLFDEQVDDICYYYPYRATPNGPVQDGICAHPAEPREVRCSYKVAF
jgi:hypothetical protein